MKSSKTLIAIALISVALLAVETFGQREPNLSLKVPGRFQICSDSDAIYAIETDTGKLWRYTGEHGFQKISQIPESE